MERGRLIEMIGSFLLGGGVVAMGYELSRDPTATGAEPVAAAASDEVGDAGPAAVVAERVPAEAGDDDAPPLVGGDDAAV
nr:hypothetical protein [Deltaproteobacteria bacterium]